MEAILKAWDKTTPSERDRGRAFYYDAYRLCDRWAREFNLRQAQVAGMMAALSPNNSWSQNQLSCRAVLEGRDRDVRSYRRDLLKALWILAGGDATRIIVGPKTTAFWNLMVDPFHVYPVCIDGHMVNLIRGEKKPLKGIHLDHATYYAMAQTVRCASTYIGELPSTVQAALWLAWRSSSGFKQGRLDL